MRRRRDALRCAFAPCDECTSRCIPPSPLPPPPHFAQSLGVQDLEEELSQLRAQLAFMAETESIVEADALARCAPLAKKIARHAEEHEATSHPGRFAGFCAREQPVRVVDEPTGADRHESARLGHVQMMAEELRTRMSELADALSAKERLGGEMRKLRAQMEGVQRVAGLCQAGLCWTATRVSRACQTQDDISEMWRGCA